MDNNLLQNLNVLFDWDRAFLMSGLGVNDAPIQPDEMKKLRTCCAELTAGMPEMFCFETEKSTDMELIEQIVLFFRTHGK